MSLDDLIDRCKKNNRKAQHELYQRYKDSLYFVSVKYCRNVAEAEDNLHDTFLDVFKSIKNYRHKGSFEGWMKRIAIHKAIDKYKTKRPVAAALNDDLLEDATVEIEPEQFGIPIEQLLQFIRELPDQYRLVFNLYQLDGYSHKEIAGMLSISEGTSKSNLHRAKLALRKRILEYTADHPKPTRQWDTKKT